MEENIKQLGKRIGDLSSLPAHLKSQLQAGKTDQIEDQIISVLKEELDGFGNIDEIMIGLYRKHNVSDKTRSYISNKLYRMGVEKKVYSIKGKKGAYSINQIQTDDSTINNST